MKDVVVAADDGTLLVAVVAVVNVLDEVEETVDGSVVAKLVVVGNGFGVVTRSSADGFPGQVCSCTCESF